LPSRGRSFAVENLRKTARNYASRRKENTSQKVVNGPREIFSAKPSHLDCLSTFDTMEYRGRYYKLYSDVSKKTQAPAIGCHVSSRLVA
jgi:hypothetical protein